MARPGIKRPVKFAPGEVVPVSNKELRAITRQGLTLQEIVAAHELPQVRPYWQERFYGWLRSVGARLMHAGR